MGLALGALAGVLSGLGGLPKGMAEGTAADQRQQQLDQQMTDVDQLYNVLGVPKPPGMGGGKVNTSTANLLATRMLSDQERQRKAGLGTQLAQQLQEGGTTTGMAPGASVSMPQPGDLMTPPAAGPAPSLTEQRVNPDMAALAKYMPTLAQLDPGKATELVADQLKARAPLIIPKDARAVSSVTGQPFGSPPPPPRPKVELRAGAGDTYAISTDPDTGEVQGQPRATGIGAPEAKGVYGRTDVEAQVNLEHTTPGQQYYGKLAPGSLARQQRYNDLGRTIMVPQGGSAFGAGTGLGGSPPPGPAQMPINPNLPLDQQPTVQGAGAVVRGAIDAAGNLPGVPPAAAQPGSPRPLIERPPSAADSTHYVNKNTLQSPPTGMTLSQIQGSGEYVQVPAGAVPVIKQGAAVNGLLQQARDVITRRDDLYPNSTGGKIRDNLNVGMAAATFMAGKRTDPDVAKLNSLLIGLPALAKAFGDTGNIAVAERLMAESSVGFNAQTKEAAKARLDTIESLIKNNLSTYGVNLPNATPPGGSGAGGGQGKVRVIAPDGTKGTWDLSRGPIPPGFKQAQ